MIKKFKNEGQEFAKFLRSLKQFIQTVKGQNIFWKQNAFLTCSWRFLISNELEQLEQDSSVILNSFLEDRQDYKNHILDILLSLSDNL